MPCFRFLTVLTLAVGTAWAHHNMSAIFDFNQRFTTVGTLTKFDWRNPHIQLSVDANGEQGEMLHIHTTAVLRIGDKCNDH